MSYLMRKQCSFCMAQAEFEPVDKIFLCGYHFKKMNDIVQCSPNEQEKQKRIKAFMENYVK